MRDPDSTFPAPVRVRRALAALTIFTIVGTLSACGRYGSPKRPTAPAALTLMESTLLETDRERASERVRVER
jgi:hypothetical protein